MFLLNLKRFLKSPIFVIGTVAYMVILYLMQPVHVATGIEDISNSTLTTQTFSFLYFLMISYEFFYQLKKHQVEEVIQVSRMGLLKEKLYGVLIFVILDAILYVVYLTVSMMGTTSVLKMVNMDWFAMLAKAYLFYHFLNYLLAILLGMLVSMISSRIKGFLTLVVIFSIFSRMVYPIIIQCANASEKWTHILDILGIMNRNYALYCDLVYNYTTEYVDLQRILFWIVLTIAILLLVVNKKEKKRYSITAFAVAAVLFVFYIQPSGERFVYGNWDAYMDEQQYYGFLFHDYKTHESRRKEDHEGIGRTYKEADFRVTNYRGTLSPKRVLGVSVDVSVDQPDMEQYCFTLYHRYLIKEVTDEDGESLEFEQDVDHVLVKNTAARDLKTIHFEYKGYSRKNVATRQAVYLPGNFPYLPMAGWNEYMFEPEEDGWMVGFNLKGAMYPIHYDLQIDTDLTVYSNLERTADNHYVGTSEGATLVASPFVKEVKLKNCIVYYPVLSTAWWIDNAEETKQELEQTVESIDGLTKDRETPIKIFDITMDANIMEYAAKDHFIGYAGRLEDQYKQYMKEKKD